MSAQSEIALATMWRLADGDVFNGTVLQVATQTGKSSEKTSRTLRLLTESGAITRVNRGISASRYRLLIRPEDYKWKPLPREGNIEWTDQLIAALRVLWAEGHSTAEIGRRLGVSKSAICGKAHRLDLPPRPSPIKGYVMGPPTRRVAKRRVSGATLPPLASTRKAPVVEAAPMPHAPSAAAHDRLMAQPELARVLARPPVVERPMVVDFRSSVPARAATPKVTYVPAGRCRFPMWGNERPTHIYCDKPIERRSYCEDHAKLCYVIVNFRPDKTTEGM